jgi:hypothetical protein
MVFPLPFPHFQHVVKRQKAKKRGKILTSTHISYTGLIGELEHLKIKTRLIDEMFASVMGEYVFLK